MAKTCLNCGKKIGTFSNDPFILSENHLICYECSEPIKHLTNALYDVKTKDEFQRIASEILTKSDALFEPSVVKEIEGKIKSILSKNTYIHSEDVINYMMTTGSYFEGYEIKKYLGIVSGQVVLGTGFLSEFTAAFADFFGAKSDQFANKLESAKQAAVRRLVLKSEKLGGNALIGVEFDYITFAANMIGVVANGTSVIIEEEF
ncbi:MAG: YbjQ family protein [Butyricicoccus sp.]|nr:YbjQ family protein [Butyricicoccus sp.]MBQ8586260.1 YbjQ family protein [Butyricicoccus sp.]